MSQCQVEFFFVSLACLGVLVGLYLNYYDASHGGVFNKPTPKIGGELEEEEAYETLLGGGEGQVRPPLVLYYSTTTALPLLLLYYTI